MKTSLSVGCVLMAAGNAERFGENKLLADYNGKALIERAFDAIPREALSRALVVTQYDSILSLARASGLESLRNEHPELGQSETIRLGTKALQNTCDALLFMVADQPLLRQESVARMLALWRAHPDKIVALSHRGKRGNPCLFPAHFYPELLALSGDIGGSAIIRRNPDDLLLCEAEERELRDVDTKSSLDALKHS